MGDMASDDRIKVSAGAVGVVALTYRMVSIDSNIHIRSLGNIGAKA
jgi:hypothetical protein